jgi:stage III sporulation protein AG
MHTSNKKGNFAWRELLQKKNALFFVGLAGVCLIGLSDILFAESASTEAAAAQETAYTAVAASEYTAALEARLAQLLAAVDGAGKVQVMLTLEGTGETFFALDEQSDTTLQTKDDEQTQRQTTYRSEHVLYDGGAGSTPLVEQQTEPEVRGVAVVCEGGDDIVVVKRITELVAVVLGLSSNRICVAKMV